MLIMLAFMADYSRRIFSFSATALPHIPASSIYILFCGEPVILSLPKQVGLKRQTITPQNWKMTVPIAFQKAKVTYLALVVWYSSWWALSHCSLPFLMGQKVRLNAIQLSVCQPDKWHRSNEKKHSYAAPVGRGSVFARLSVHAAPVKFPSTTEVRPC